MRPYTAPPGTAWRLGAGPFVFRGKPPFCTGELELINDSTEKVKVRAIPTLADRPETPIGHVRLAARLEPGARQRVGAHVVVEPNTPPGTYAAQLAIEGLSERITVHVFEKRAIVLAPGTVVLRGARGEALTHPLIISNRGNLAQAIPAAVLVHLEERDWLGRSLVYALRELGADEGHQSYLDRVVREMRATDIPPLRVVVHRETDQVLPGETVEARLELTVPEKLAKGRTYVRRFPFMATTLTLQIDCYGTIHSNDRRTG